MSEINFNDFEERYIPEPNSGCWIWLGSGSNNGYGRYKSTGAHRIAYELYKGKIQNGLVIDHLCRVPLCVNPNHLEQVTSRENTLRGISTAAVNARKTECSKGHEFTPENLIIKRGRRYCRPCQRKFNLQNYYRSQARKKALQEKEAGE